MTASGFIVAAVAGWLLTDERNSTRFVTGSILLIGLAVHLVGIAFVLDQYEMTGALISGFYFYATATTVGAGWWIDVRLVTALAIAPFAQALDTSTFHFDAAYVFHSPESTLSIIQMAILISVCTWLAARHPERIARHARVLAVMAFVVANLCALVRSLWGDYIGETVWGLKDPEVWSELGYEEYYTARDAFFETAVFVTSDLYSVLWAAAMVSLILWSAHKAQCGHFNASITFAGIHA